MDDKKTRTFVFIDGENIRNSVESYGYKDLDYEKLYSWFKEKKDADRIYIYVGIEDGDGEKEKKFSSLQTLGYTVSVKKVMLYKQKPLSYKIKCKNCHTINEKLITRHSKLKANCDTELTLDIINGGVRKKYDKIIVFSGDGDFSIVYEYVVNELKKEVTVYTPLGYPHSTRTSSKIKELSKNKTIDLEDLGSLLQHYGLK